MSDRLTTRALPELHPSLILVDSGAVQDGAFEDRGVWTTDGGGVLIGTTLVTVHWDELLTAVTPIVATGDDATVRRAQCLGAALHALEREDDILALRLLYERHCGEESRWAHHISLLPNRLPHCLLHWTADELLGLAGCSIETTARAWRAQVGMDYGDLCATSFELDGETKTIGSTFGAKWLSSETYVWALSMIWSRFVSVQREDVVYKSMAPTFDLFNHTSDARETHAFDPTADVLRLVTLGTIDGTWQSGGAPPRAWGASEEVCINYGLGNAKLLLHHGFIESAAAVNPRDAVPITLGLASGMPQWELKRDLLAASSFEIASAECGAVQIEMSAADPIPPLLIAMLRLRRAEDASPAALTAALEGDATWTALGAAVEIAALDDLHAAIAPMLARLAMDARVVDEEDSEDDESSEEEEGDDAGRAQRADDRDKRGMMATRLRELETAILLGVTAEIARMRGLVDAEEGLDAMD